MLRVTIKENPSRDEHRYHAWVGEVTPGQPGLVADTPEGIVTGLRAHADECTDGTLYAFAPRGLGCPRFRVGRDFDVRRNAFGKPLTDPLAFWTFSIAD